MVRCGQKPDRSRGATNPDLALADPVCCLAGEGPQMQFDRLRRRDFITLAGGAAAAWPTTAWAQQPGKLPKIGFLGSGSPSTWSAWTAAFMQRLNELDWVQGRTVAIEMRWAEGDS